MRRSGLALSSVGIGEGARGADDIWRGYWPGGAGGAGVGLPVGGLWALGGGEGLQ